LPTLTFGVPCCFFFAPDRRRILQCNASRHPAGARVIQQLCEAFSRNTSRCYLIFDRGSSFNAEIIDAVRSFPIKPKRTSFRSSWQNGVAEHWAGSCRRDLLDHVIVLEERHLKRAMREYVHYDQEGRTHLALANKTRIGRKAEKGVRASGNFVSVPRLGGPHPRCDLSS
jgi:hypothetical protein